MTANANAVKYINDQINICEANGEIDFDKALRILTTNAPKISGLIDASSLSYGRYKIATASNYICELHIHSPGYRGLIHNHGTIGLMVIITGNFEIEDWINTKDAGFLMSRRYIIGPTMATQIMNANDSDWHRTTNCSNTNAVSLHIYGAEYDRLDGHYYDEDTKMILSRTRSLSKEIT